MDDAVARFERWGEAPVLLVCEHASNAIPARWGDLGLAPGTREAHVAWDLGALGLARALAEGLEGALVSGTVSRLLYDLNRPPEASDAIPERSERYDIPGNRLDAAGRAERVDAIHAPWCVAMGDALRTVRPAVLLSVHSFTPAWFGRPRATRVGILHGRDARLADAMLAGAAGLGWERNAPYGPGDGVLHTVETWGEANGMLTAMIEVRNDLLAEPSGAAAVAGDLLRVLRPALAVEARSATGAER